MTSPLEQKKIKITQPSVVTANRTWDGAVIYRTGRSKWSTDLSEAAVVRTADEARALLAESVADDLGAVGAYIAPVEIGEKVLAQTLAGHGGRSVAGSNRRQRNKEVMR